MRWLIGGVVLLDILALFVDGLGPGAIGASAGLLIFGPMGYW